MSNNEASQLRGASLLLYIKEEKELQHLMDSTMFINFIAGFDAEGRAFPNAFSFRRNLYSIFTKRYRSERVCRVYGVPYVGSCS